MFRLFLCVMFLAMAAVEAEAAIETRPILGSPEYVYAHQTKSIPLYLGGPVRILSMKVQASSVTRQSVNTNIFVAGLNVGTIMLPGRNPDPSFAAGGSGTELTSSVEFTSNSGTVEISQIYVTFERPEAAAVVEVAPVLPFDAFIVRTPLLRAIEKSNAYAYYGDLAVAVIDAMLSYVSPMEWQLKLFPLKWQASELRNLAKAYGSTNRDVLDAADALVAAVDAQVDFLMEKSLTQVTWPYVTDVVSIREKLAMLSGNRTRLPMPAKITKPDDK